MSEEVYRQLARHLDDLPGGFPSSESGVELRILKRLFSPEQAVLAVSLTIIPEEARTIAERSGLDIEETAKRLEVMARNGLIFSIEEGTPGALPGGQLYLRHLGISTQQPEQRVCPGHGRVRPHSGC